MSEPRERNIAALHERNREDLAQLVSTFQESGRFQVETAKSGVPTLVFSGKSLNSRYDPVHEAQQQVLRLSRELPPETSVVLIGLGLGYFVEAWRRSRPGDRCFVLEPDKELFQQAAQLRELHEIIAGTELYVGRSGLHTLATTLREQGLANGRSPALIEWPGVHEYASDAARSLLHKLMASGQHRTLRVLVAGPVYGGTLPIGPCVTRALNELGHRAEWLDLSGFDDGRRFLDSVSGEKKSRERLLHGLTQLLGQAVLAKAKDVHAQIVFFLAQAPGTREVLRALRRDGIVSAMWFVEDAGLATWWQQVAPEYDVFFHIQGEPFTRQLLKAGARHAHYLPVAADPGVHRPLDLTPEEQSRFGGDLSHVGAGYFNRRRFFLQLLDHPFKLWGNDWDDAPGLQSVLQERGRRLTTDETVKVFNATRINLNLHSSTYVHGVNPHGDFVNPRTFEIASCGAFQLVDRRSLLADLFEPGRELAVFSDLDDCRCQIEHYLAYPDEARAIAEAGRQRVLRDHTYQQRMAEAMRVILEHAPLHPLRNQGETFQELAAASGDDRELVEFITSAGPPDEIVSLASLAEKIKQGEGELSRPEALFLLLQEFQLRAEEKGFA